MRNSSSQAILTRRVLAVLAVAILFACQSSPVATPWFGGANAKFTQEDLRRGLLLWSETASSVITATAGEIHGQARDPRLRRLSLLWKVRMIPVSRRVVLNPDPRKGSWAPSGSRWA